MAGPGSAIFQLVFRDVSSPERLDPRLCIVPASDSSHQEALECSNLSFCGTTQSAPEGVIDWIIGTAYREPGDELYGPLSAPPSLQRLQAFSIFNNLLFGKTNLRLCLRDPSTHSILGVANVKLPYNATPFTWLADEIKSLWAAGPVRALCLPRDVLKRAFFIGHIFEARHSETMRGERHYYVGQVAVHPEHQGRGVGSAILRAVNALADRDGLSCFLETSGERNAKIYEKSGYQRCHAFEPPVAVPGRPDLEPFMMPGGLIAMVRPVRKEVK